MNEEDDNLMKMKEKNGLNEEKIDFSIFTYLHEVISLKRRYIKIHY